jgi:hypothetical protein
MKVTAKRELVQMFENVKRRRVLAALVTQVYRDRPDVI